jgi:perosamine synthetase
VLGPREEQYVLEAVRSGYVSSRGPFVTRFERGFAEYIGSRHGVAVSSGTAALHVALLALGIGPGDEVIVPSFTMIAAANAVRYTGARPILVDSERATWNLDPDGLERLRTPRTKAVLVVHTYGHPADMDPIQEWAQRHGIPVVEDAAEAHGAEYRGRRVGRLGVVGCFSFYANKIITTGEGGMVVTDRPELAERIALLRDQAFAGPRRFLHEIVGYNYRLTNLQAAVGVAQLERIDEFVAARRRHAHAYARLLEGAPGVEGSPEAAWAKSVFWMYCIRVDASRRDALAKRLSEVHGIETRPFFVPVHRQPAYRDQGVPEHLAVSEALSGTGLNLPSASNLTDPQLERICEAIRESLARPL